MKTITCISVNGALYEGLSLIQKQGIKTSSRNGDTVEVPFPVTTVYKDPHNKVLLSSVRDCNPFFHVMESLWILAGRADAKFLCEFNKRMIDYSDDGIVFNAPYGYRMRYAKLIDENGINYAGGDQIKAVIRTLKAQPESRQAVIQIWDQNDLWDSATKDKACNMSVVFRVRQGKLTMTVYNRSNDIIWGAYGANVVQFSTLMEYVGAHLGLPLGDYTHVSNSYHVYLGGPGGKKYNELIENRHALMTNPNVYQSSQCIRISSTEIDMFERDLAAFFQAYNEGGCLANCITRRYYSRYFKDLVTPMVKTWIHHRSERPIETMEAINHIESDDWRKACEDWIYPRIEKRNNRNKKS